MCEHIVVETEDKIIITTFKGETLTVRTIISVQETINSHLSKENLKEIIKGCHERCIEDALRSIQQ